MANNKSGVIQNKQQQNAVKKAENKQLTMRDYVGKMAKPIEQALPTVITPERFTRMVFTALSTNPQLNECTPDSFVGAMMTAAQLGVEPNTALGQAYIIPYRNHGTLEAQFQLGYKGLIDLAYRSGEVSVIQAHEVCENDTFEYELGMDPKLKHIPATKNRGKVIAYYAMFKTKDGGYGFEVMSREDVEAHAQKYSKSYGSYSSPWKSNFDEMAKKTVLKKVLKYAPLKSDFARAVVQDSTIKHGIHKNMMDEPDNTIFAGYEIIDDDVAVDPETGEVVNVDAYGDVYGNDLIGGNDDA